MLDLSLRNAKQSQNCQSRYCTFDAFGEKHGAKVEVNTGDEVIVSLKTLTNVFDLSLCLVTTLQMQIRFAYY
jgi:hypothetical protein